MKNSTFLFLGSICAALITAGCASRPKFVPVSSIPQDRALVYFYGPKDGTFAGCRIDYNGKRLTTLRAGDYFAHQPKTGVQPYSVPAAGQVGLVGFMLDQPGVETTRIRLQPGKVYYMKAVGVGTLLRVDDATGSHDIAECHLAKAGDVPAEELPPAPVSAK